MITGVDDKDLFRDCLNDSVDVLVGAFQPYLCSARRSSANGVHPTATESVFEEGVDAQAQTASSASHAQTKVVPSSFGVKIMPRTSSSSITSHVIMISQSDTDNDTAVTDLSFKSLPREVRQGIESVEDDGAVMGDLNTAGLYCDAADHAHDAYYMSSNVANFPYDRMQNISGVNNFVEDFRSDEEVRHEVEINHVSNVLIPENEPQGSVFGEATIHYMTSDESMRYSEVMVNPMAVDVNPPHCLKDSIDLQFSSRNGVEAIAAQLEEPSISYGSTSKDNQNVTNEKKQQAEPSVSPKKRNHKRAHISLNSSQESSLETEVHPEAEDQCTDENPCWIVVFVGCNFQGCGKKLLWRRRYGKNRLLDHVRTHWNNAVKSCKICDYKASCPRKVYRHHKLKHGDVPYMGVKSTE
ncbi:hypothetical protein COOONC_09781 [Cooperia oncophora]